MKEKIVLLPLDNRPCNYDFPYQLFFHEKFDIVRIEKTGDKKVPVDAKRIKEFLKKECRDAYGLVLSVDMLLYGGLVPSRIHHKKKEDFMEMANLIRELKQENPKLCIYAFQVIMRCPSYSNADEEPDYYDTYGEMIHKAGEIIHKSRLGLCKDDELKNLMEEIDYKALTDYVERRQINCEMNCTMIDFVKEGLIDTLVIPQDDSAQYGYAAMDQETVRDKIRKENLSDSILMYPGADEVGLTLMSRVINQIYGKRPKVYLKYMCEAAKYIIPLYEGNQLGGTLKSHVLAAGGQLTDSYECADIILVITAPADKMQEAVNQPADLAEYYAERNLYEFVDFIKERKKEGKIITIADNAYANGGDLELIQMLNQNNLLLEVDGYAGWNTSANTIGTAIALGMDSFYFGKTKEHIDFLVQRYLEDAGYCSVVRNRVSEQIGKYEYNYFFVGEEKGKVSEMVEKELMEFARKELSSIYGNLQLLSVYMPWKRMFEVGLTTRYEK